MRVLYVIGFVGLSLLAAGLACAAEGKVAIQATAPDPAVSGEMSLVEVEGGLKIEVTISNVPPGLHGFHFHENGSCADGGQAAGGHFNPDTTQHGFLPEHGHEHAHAGDMGNIEAGADGMASLGIFMPGLTLSEGPYSVMGKAVILHEKEDDFGQPTGNAGGRIGCGIVEVEAPPGE